MNEKIKEPVNFEITIVSEAGFRISPSRPNITLPVSAFFPMIYNNNKTQLYSIYIYLISPLSCDRQSIIPPVQSRAQNREYH